MVDKITKIVQKMTAKNRSKIDEVVCKILVGDTENLQVKKLKGFKNMFRVRVGDYRIIYFDDGNEVILKNIRKRDESTYSDL